MSEGETSWHWRDALFGAQRELLEGLASGADTNECMERLCASVEGALRGEVHCTVLRRRGDALYPGAIGSLPEPYREAVKAFPIGAEVGSCGASAALQQLIVDPDLTMSPRWTELQWAVRDFSLGSCWSIPVYGIGGEGVIGTFAVYGERGRAPDEAEVRFLEELAQVTGLVLSRASSQEALYEERRRLKHIVEQTMTGIWEWDLATDRIWLNERAAAITGGILDELQESTVNELMDMVHPDDVEHAYETVMACVNGETEFFEFESRVLLSDGTWRWVNDRGGIGERAPDGSPLTVLGALHDITERKRAEAEMARVQKLEGLGRLAGGVAHDFNNILVGIFGGIALAKEELDEDDPARLDLELAEDSLERARDLTAQLLTFAKGGAPVRKVLDLSELVKRVVQFDLSGSSIKPVFELEHGLWNADVDASQIQQVFSNLTMNAREEMVGAGRLFVSLENHEVGESEELEPGMYIRARVRDEGDGIEAEIMDRIFEPYFSTKVEGTGLGLATVYSIVKRHGGTVSVESSSEGTTFELLLPATMNLVESSGSELGVAEGRSLKILVMDDQWEVRETCSRMLRGLGHETRTASGSEEALAVFAEGGFDIVILDITVPGERGGTEVLQRLREIDPGVRAIASTGYAEESIVSSYRQFGFDQVLPKPYTIAELAAALARVAPDDDEGPSTS